MLDQAHSDRARGLLLGLAAGDRNGGPVQMALCLADSIAASETQRYDATPAPDGGFGWVVVFGSWLSLFTFLGQLYSFSVLYPVLLEEFKASEGTTALAHGIATGMMNVCGFVSGPLMQVLSYRQVGLLAAVWLSCSYLVCSFSNSIGMVSPLLCNFHIADYLPAHTTS